MKYKITLWQYDTIQGASRTCARSESLLEANDKSLPMSKS